MNGDHRYYHAPPSNAVAGPSKPPQAPSPLPEHASLGGTASTTAPVAGPSSSPQHHSTPLAPVGLFLPPPVPPPPKQHLRSTQDLLARFQLLTAYDRYVRPAILPGNEAAGSGAGGTISTGSGDKGKGKEVEPEMGSGGANVGSEGAPGAGEDDEDGAGGKGDKKHKNNYKHLIKGLPGKHSMKKDEYLTNIMLFPPKPLARISYFDERVQSEAFEVSPEGLKGWNANALVLESAQAREDRRKRKELKKLAKLQQQQQAQGIDVGAHPGVPLQAPAPTTAQAASFKPQGTGTPSRNPSTPRSAPVGGGTPRPGSTVARPGSTASRVGTPAATPGVQSIPGSATKPSIARPGSTVPRSGSSAAGAAGGLPPRPGSVKPAPVASQGVSTPHGEYPRGQKRQREEGHPVNGQQQYQQQQHQMANGNGVANGVSNGVGHAGGNVGLPPRPVLNAKAGSGGVRPRPTKKPRMEGNGQVQQQPTPQGV